MLTPDDNTAVSYAYPGAYTGRFCGYASYFDVQDLGQDLVRKGAFQRVLRQKPACDIAMLFQHDPNHLIGRWLKIEEREQGLYVEGQLNLGVSKARELLALMADGCQRGLSIGYKTVSAVRVSQSRANKTAKGLRHLTDIDLWEISLVTFPMLPQAKVHWLERAETEAKTQQFSQYTPEQTPAGLPAEVVRRATSKLIQGVTLQ